MIKILMFGVTNVNGGIENFALNYAKHINNEKIRIDIVDIYNGITYEKEFKNIGSKIIKISNYRRKPIHAFLEIKKYIKEEKYDVIHFNMNSAVFLNPIIYGKILGVKTIIAHSHNASNDKGIIKSVLHSINKKLIPFFANKYLACSDKAAKYFYSNKKINSDKFCIINNAIETEKFLYSPNIRRKKRQELGIKEDSLIIGHVGRFNKQKNHEFLIDIFQSISQKEEKAKLLLIGTGELKTKIQEKSKQMNILTKIIFLENRVDVNELMQCMDILVMPSLYEGLSLVTVEAQAASLPCVLSDTISNESKIIDKTIFVSLDKKADEWADKILELKKNCSRKNEMQQVLNKNFDINTEAKKLINLYIR